MTSRSICASAGRGPKLGEASARAYRYQPPCHKAGLARMSWRSGVVIERVKSVIMARCHDVQAGNAVADLAQAQAQFGGGGRPVKAGLLQIFESRALQSAGRSSRRSRSGGITISITLSR